MSRSARRGMSLIEVLVVVAIVAILIGLLLPGNRRVRESAARMQCLNNLKQLMIALHAYSDTAGKPVAAPSPDRPAEPLVGRAFPTGCVGPGATPDERLGWAVALLPYLEQEPLSKRFDVEKGYAGNLSAARTPVKTFLCPAAQEAAAGNAVTHYVAMSGLGPAAAVRPAGAPGNGFMGYDRLTAMGMITDGSSNTIALAETRHDLGPWARGGTAGVRGFDPADVPLHGDGRQFGGHTGGMAVAMADGSVRFVRASIEPQKLAAAVTVAGGEPFNLD